MANKKFSEFTLKTDPANVDFVVGYDGTDNVRIDPSNLGGGGASDLNGLTDCLVDTLSLYVGEVPSGLSGNPQDNTVLGIDAGASITSANTCTIIGSNAGNSITTGNRQTIVGHDAGSSITTSGSNTIFGYEAGKGISGFSDRNVVVGDMACRTSAGDDNVAIGSSAGYSWNNAVEDAVAIGSYASSVSNGAAGIVAIGRKAARANTSANHISIGFEAGYSNTTGQQNTNIGYEAGYSNTTNAFRTCIGWKAGRLNTGTGNTFIGNNAGADRANVEGSSTAVGNSAGRYWESGSNTALGENAGQYANGTSRYNVMVGREALGGAFGSKSNNVAVGYKSGWAATTGGNNVFVGYEAGVAHTTAQQSTIIGYHAGLQITTANNNTLIGHQAGVAVTGAENTLIGTFAGRTLTSGTTNTMVGVGYNGGGITTGSNNTLIGNAAAASSTSVSNEITLGNSSVTSLRCAVTSITSLSDERDKSEIKDLEYGLAFIDALQPREFVWDNRPETTVEVDEDGNETEVEFYSANKGKKDFGFIAQEVRELDNDTLRLVYSENEERLELSYGKLVPILVKAIQELKEEVELLKS